MSDLLLTREERLQAFADYYSCRAVDITKVEFYEYLCSVQLAHCTPLIEKQERRKVKRAVYKDIGEGLCNLIGNIMLEDMEVGKKLAEQLEGTLKYCQHETGIIFKGGSNG